MHDVASAIRSEAPSARPSKVMPAADAVGLVRSGSTLAVGGAGGVQEPDLLLSALVARFRETGEPTGITEVHPIRTGEIVGRGTSAFGEPGLVRKMIGGSFWPAGAPPLVQLIQSGEIEAYNLPIGVLYGLLEATAAGRPGIVTPIGLDTCIDPAHGGGSLNDRSREKMAERIEIGGKTCLFYHAFPVDTAFIRATTADEDGNLTMEEEPAVCGAMALAQAARASGGTVIAQVRRIVPRGHIAPHAVKVPGILVDVVVEHPGQWQTTAHRYQPSAVGHERLDLATLPPRPLDADKIALRRALMAARPGEVLVIGFGVPGFLPAIAVEEQVLDLLTFTVEHGVVGGVNGYAAGGRTFPMAHNPEAIIDAADMLRLYSGGGVDRAFLGVGELDAGGNVNVSRFGPAIPGTGGFIEITQGIRRVVFCTVLGDKGARKLVEKVRQVTFSAEHARRSGQEVLYVTEKAVFGLGPRGLELRELAPGLDLERDLLATIGCRIEVPAGFGRMPECCFRPEPMDLRAAWTRAMKP